MKKKISIIVPMYNEEDMVTICYKELKKVMDKEKEYTTEYIFINDGSSDRTEELLAKLSKKSKAIKVINFSRNFGHQAAVEAGLKHITGDAIAIIDADLQDPPSLIPEMLKLWEDGYDIIYGKRKTRKGESKFKLLTAKMFYKILNSLSDTPIPRDTGDFRVIDRSVANAINEFPEHHKFYRGLFSFTGFKQTPFLYNRDPRKAGVTKYTLKKMLKLASDGIIGFSYKPIKLIIILGIILNIISIVSLILTITIKKYYLIFLLITLFSFNTSLILLSIWLISLYLIRINDETKNRPSYIIKNTINIKET